MGVLYAGKLTINFVAFIGLIIAGMVTILAGVQATNIDTGMLRVRTTSIIIVGALLIVMSFTPLFTALNWINMHRSSKSRKAFGERAARQARWELMLDEDLLIDGTSREGSPVQAKPVPVDKLLDLGKEKYVTSEHEHIQITSTDLDMSLNLKMLDLDSNYIQYRSDSERPLNETVVLDDESVKIAMIEQLVATKQNATEEEPIMMITSERHLASPPFSPTRHKKLPDGTFVPMGPVTYTPKRILEEEPNQIDIVTKV